MSGFRKTSYPIAVFPPSPIIQIQETEYEEVVDGNTLKRVVYVPLDLCSNEAASSLPTYKEFYLEELLKAGIPLDQLNVSGYFNQTDVESLNIARSNAIDRLSEKIVSSSNIN